MSGQTSGRPLSAKPDAVRKREARQKTSDRTSTTAAGRGGAESTKGNPLPPSSPGAKMGEPVSAAEAERDLRYLHQGIAKVIRSDVDFAELDEEFEVAGRTFADVANHMWTPLRVVLRFVAPVVLLGALLVIWGAMFAATPWMGRLREWWTRRRETEEVPAAPEVVVEHPPEPARRMHVVADEPAAETVVPAPPIPRRPAMVRNLRGLRH